LLADQGRRSDAIRHLEFVLAHDPGHAPAKAAFGKSRVQAVEANRGRLPGSKKHVSLSLSSRRHRKKD
jgi:hypothetical protein